MTSRRPTPGRLLSFAERMVDVDGRASWNGITVVRLAGHCDPEEFRRALAVLQHRHPVLASRIERDDGRPRLVRMHPPPPIEMRVLQRVDLSAWRAMLEPELALPLPTAEGRMLRVVMLLDAAGCDLLLVTNHAGFNGRSRMAMLGALVRLAASPAEQAAMRAEAPVGMPDTLEALLGAEPHAGLGLRAAAAASVPLLRLLAWRRARLEAGRSAPAPVHVTAWTLPPEREAALRAGCRAHGISPAAAIAVASLRAFRDLRGARARNRLACSVDVMARLPGLPAGVPLAFADWVDLGLRDPAAGFWEQARTLKADLDRGSASIDPVRRAAVGETLHGAADAILTLLMARRPYQDVALSHLGTVRWDVPAPAAGEPPPPFRVEQVLGTLATFPWRNTCFLYVMHHGGEAQFFLVARPPHLSRAEAGAIAERIDAVLGEVAF